MTTPRPTAVDRFAANLDRLSPAGERVGLAVSGGPDSMALLLLAAAARPGRVKAITVDHALRAESQAEAKQVAEICAQLGVPHEIVRIDWDQSPATAIQEQARSRRYAAITGWLRRRGIGAVATGHHAGDQAETLLMRLNRGAGVRGLAAMRPSSPMPDAAGLTLLRPLLDWTRDELADVCRLAGIEPVTDPSNQDARFERVRVRRQLAEANLDAAAIARAADHLGKADEAIEWAVSEHWASRVRATDLGFDYDPSGAPEEIRRRTVARIIAAMGREGPAELRGSELDRLLECLAGDGVSTLRGVQARGGRTWSFRSAPKRALGCG